MNDDLELFGWATARATDPVTSHEAAKEMRKERAGTIQKKIVALLTVKSGGLICAEIVEILKERWNTISPRLKPMRRLGLIHDSGETRVSPETNRRQIVWKLGSEPKP